MDATTLSITLSAILAVICIPCGLFLGLVPMKADLVTAKQSKASADGELHRCHSVHRLAGRRP